MVYFSQLLVDFVIKCLIVLDGLEIGHIDASDLFTMSILTYLLVVLPDVTSNAHTLAAHLVQLLEIGMILI